MSRLGSARIRNWATELLCVAAVLAPLTVCLASDVIHTSLWLDEVTYHYYEDDMALRAAELGRSGRFLAPYVGVFFNCDVQHLLHRVFRAFGLTLQRDPEAYLRLPSVVWYVVAVLAFYTFLRLRLSHRLDALLGGLSFSSTPIFLHYAFEARVYSLTLMLVVLLLIAVEAAGKKPTRGSLLLVAAFGLVAAHSQLWTVCLFFALVLVAGLPSWRLGGLTSWGRAALAASLPALTLIGAETLYMRATDPGAPVFPPFFRQQGLLTLWQLLISNFAGVTQTQYVVLGTSRTMLLALGGVFAILALAYLSARDRREAPDGSRASDWIEVGLLSLFFCWLLAVGYGFFIHARYHVSLMGSVFLGVALFPSKRKRLVLALLVACNVGLLPETVQAIQFKASVKQMAELIRQKGGRSVSVICQHVVTGGYPLPAQSMVLDFYLNVLHPDETPIRIYEKPDLTLTTGRRGVYDFFNAGSPGLERYLKSMPEVWREKRDQIGDHLFILDQYWNIEKGNQQNLDFARVMLEQGDLEVAGKYLVPGFPKTFIVEVRRKAGP